MSDTLQGEVKWAVYDRYFLAVSIPFCAIILLFMLLARGGSIVESWWLKKWGEAYKTQSSSGAMFTQLLSSSVVWLKAHVLLPSTAPFGNIQEPSDISAYVQLPSAQDHVNFYLSMYIAIAFGAVLIEILSVAMGYVGAYHACKRLFVDMLHRVAHAPSRWFDTTPSGRILNRFSKVCCQLQSSRRVLQ
jgi:ABC-type multidrug transport system fused ATPase/permease subunit